MPHQITQLGSGLDAELPVQDRAERAELVDRLRHVAVVEVGGDQHAPAVSRSGSICTACGPEADSWSQWAARRIDEQREFAEEIKREIIEFLDSLTVGGVAIEEGPVERTGPISSVSVRDPDGNLIELSNCRD